MKICAVLSGISFLFLVGGILAAPPPGLQPVVGRTIYHSDDSRTESIRDPNTRELTELTYTAAGALTTKKVFLLNEKGEPVQGNVYDGRGTLVARCQSLYDEFGRRKEDRLTNLRGEVFQQVIHEYGKDGKALPPKVVNLDAQSPMMKPAAVDFTRPGALPPADSSSSRFAPATIPNGAPAGQPGSAVPSQPKPEEKPKANFFKKLFKKE